MAFEYDASHYGKKWTDLVPIATNMTYDPQGVVDEPFVVQAGVKPPAASRPAVPANSEVRDAAR